MQAVPHTVDRLILRRHVRSTLDRDVWIGNSSRGQLPDRTKIKSIRRRHPPPLFEDILQLLKDGVLKNWIDDEDQCGQHAREERTGALVADEGYKCPNRGRCFPWTLFTSRKCILFMLFPRRHACVHNPDGICQQHRRRPRNGTRDHALHRGKLLARAAGLLRGFLKECPRPLVPIVIDEIRNGYAKEGGIETSIQAGEAFTLDDVLDGGEEGGGGAGSLDLGAGGERDERVGECHSDETATCAGEGMCDVV